LKWSDVDFENGLLHVTRSVVDQTVGACKTEASQKPVLLDSILTCLLDFDQAGFAPSWMTLRGFTNSSSDPPLPSFSERDLVGPFGSGRRTPVDKNSNRCFCLVSIW
jgi:hypothetical protein